MRPATAGCNIEHAWPACITILLRLLLTVYMPGLSVNRPSSVQLCRIRDSLRNHYQSVRPGFWLIKLACMFAATVLLLSLYLAVLPWFVCLLYLWPLKILRSVRNPLKTPTKPFSKLLETAANCGAQTGISSHRVASYLRRRKRGRPPGGETIPAK